MKRLFTILLGAGIVSSIALSPVVIYANEINQENPSVISTIQSFASQVVTLNNPVKIETPRTGFEAAEEASFELRIPEKNNDKIGSTQVDTWKTEEEEISVQIKNTDTDVSIPGKIKKTEEGTFQLIAEKNNDWTPGNYQLDVSAKETFFYTRDLTQNFSWGVLAVNTNKSMYLPGETAKLSFGILDELGHTLCDAPLSLKIIDPEGKEKILSRDNGEIQQSGECSGDSITEKPDYLASYKISAPGTYWMVLTGTNENGSHTISDYFIVSETIPFEIERTKFPTRVYPMAPYDVEITVKVNQDYKGVVQDFVPKAFYIENISNGGTITQTAPVPATMPAEVLATDAKAYSNIPELSELMYDSKVKDATDLDKTPNPITWNVDWKAGQKYTLTYSINFPTVSPEFFLIGPFTVGEFAETRQWQVANDATRTWDGGGADNNFSTANNWSSNLTPGSGDTAVFGGAGTGAASGINKNCTIDSSITIQSMTLSATTNVYNATVTQSGSFTITLNTGNLTIAAGTFVGGTGNITLSANGADFSQTGGTYTSTSGKLLISDNFTVSGGTWNHGNGTLGWTDAGDDSYTISANGATFYNFSTVDTCGGTITFTNGHTYTISNQLNFGNSCGGGTTLTAFGGTATINVTGNINVTQTGVAGNGAGVFIVNGTGNQIIDGETDGDSRLPKITINKASGNLTITDTVVFDDNTTFTSVGSGSFITTGSTVVFTAVDNSGTKTLTGTWQFNNVSFGDPFDGGDTITVSTGTIQVNGTLTIGAAAVSAATMNTASSGAIQARGNINVVGGGATGSLVVTVNGTVDQTMDGENDTDNRLPPITLNKSSGIFNLTDNFTPAGTLTLTAGTQTHSTGTMYFGNNTTLTGSWTFNNVRWANGGFQAATISSGTTVTVNGTSYLDPQAANEFIQFGGSGTIHQKGDVYVTDGGISNNITMVINGTGAQLIDGTAGSNATLPNITIDKPSGTLTFTDNFDVVFQSWTYIQGTIDASASTIFFRNSMEISGSHTLGNIVFCPGNNNPIYLNNATLTATGNVNFDHPTGCSETFSDQMDVRDGTVVVQGDLISYDAGIGGDINITFSGNNDQSWNVPTTDEFPTGTVTINKEGGIVSPVMDILLTASGQDLVFSSGELDLASYDLTVNDLFSVGQDAAVYLTGDQTISTGSTSFNGSAEYSGTGTYTSLVLGNSYNELYINGSGTYSPSSSVTVSSTFGILAGTFNAPNNLSIGGDFIKLGTFNHGNNTVTITGDVSEVTLSGNITFYNLAVPNGNKLIALDDSFTYEVTNSFVVNGSVSAPVYLSSTTPGVQADFNVTYGSPTVAGLVGTDINSCGGEIIYVVSGGSGGNVSCWSFSVEGYYNPAWENKVKLIIDKDLVSNGPHTDFPVLVQITSNSALAAGAQADGDDILFTASDGLTLLDFEIQSYSAGTLTAWVEIPSISSESDTNFYMYYNNPAAASSLQDPEGTWSNGYHAVWHMEQNPTAGNNEILDSTSNNRDGSAQSYLTSSNVVSGIVGNGLDFDGGGGDNQLVRVAGGAGLNNASTGSISLWVQWRGSQASVYPGDKYGAIMAREQNGVFGNNILALNGANPASSPITWTFQNAGEKTITGTTNAGDGVWRYVTVTFTSGNHRLYVNGQQEGTSATSGNLNNNAAIDFTFGGWEGQGKPDVIMDELRISSITRTQGWIETEYNNMNNPSSFVVLAGNSGSAAVKINGGTKINGGVRIELD